MPPQIFGTILVFKDSLWFVVQFFGRSFVVPPFSPGCVVWVVAGVHEEVAR